MLSNIQAVCPVARLNRALHLGYSLRHLSICAAISILILASPSFGQDAKKPLVSKSDILKTPKNTLPEPKKSEIIRAPKGEATPIKAVEKESMKKEPVAPILSAPGSQGGPKPSVEPLTVEMLSKPKEEKEKPGRTIITAPSGLDKTSESEAEILKKPSS